LRSDIENSSKAMCEKFADAWHNMRSGRIYIHICCNTIGVHIKRQLFMGNLELGPLFFFNAWTKNQGKKYMINSEHRELYPMSMNNMTSWLWWRDVILINLTMHAPFIVFCYLNTIFRSSWYHFRNFKTTSISFATAPIP
jgi:hypothetical protein